MNTQPATLRLDVAFSDPKLSAWQIPLYHAPERAASPSPQPNLVKPAAQFRRFWRKMIHLRRQLLINL